MWETFDKLVLQGFTVRRIREELGRLGYDISAYQDPFLIRRMLRVLRGEQSVLTSPVN